MKDEDTIEMGAVTGRLRALAQDMNLTILIVDDDELERALISDRLEARGFEVVRAANGAEALTSQRGRPRTPEVLAAESLRASRAKANGLTQARAQIAELERKVGQQQLDLDFFKGALQHIEDSRLPSDEPGVTTSSPPSSTRRRASASACKCSKTSPRCSRVS